MSDRRSDVAVLVAAAKRGNEDAWIEIVDRYTPLVVTVGRHYCLSAGELQDLAQTVWLRLVEHVCDLREPRALPMWLITTARHEAQRSRLEATRVNPTDPQGEDWESQLGTCEDPVVDLLRAERRAALLQCIAALSSRQQQLMTILVEDPPVSYAEISRRTGMPVGAIGPTRARALERLRRTNGDAPGRPGGGIPAQRRGT